MTKRGRKPIIPVDRRITIEDLIDYCECPNKYILRKKYGEVKSQSYGANILKSINQKADDAITNIALHFFFSKMGSNKNIGVTRLLKDWENIWFKDYDADDIMASQFQILPTNILRMNTYMVRGILRMSDHFELYEPLAIKEKISVSTKHAFLESEIPVLLSKNGELSIWFFSHHSTPIHVTSRSKIWKYWATQAAFEAEHKKRVEIRVYLAGALPGKQREFIVPYRENNLEIVRKKIDDIFLEKKELVKSKCYNCVYKYPNSQCEMWSSNNSKIGDQNAI